MNEERLKDLLFVYLNARLDQEELDELMLYVKDEAYTTVFYAVMDQDWEQQKMHALLSNQEQDDLYTQIIADPRFKAAPVRHSLFRTFRLFSVRTAAAAAVLAILSTGIYFLGNPYRHTTSQYDNDVNPGGNKAVLTLANGSRITLDQAKEGQLAEQAGTKVTKTAAGQLVYTVLTNGEQQAADTSYNTLQTPRGGEYQLVLPDGTKVWLNAASTLKYPAQFAAKGERKVILNGEAYFEVAHNKNSPFRVVTAQQVVEVLGTHFNVNAYANEPDTKTTLLEGSVKVAQPGAGKTLLLKPGQQAQTGAGNIVVDVDTETAVAWKNGDFILKDEDFKTTMRKIARWYDVDVIYDVSAPQDLELGGWVSRTKNISAVLKVIESTGKVHFKVQGRRITVIK